MFESSGENGCPHHGTGKQSESINYFSFAYMHFICSRLLNYFIDSGEKQKQKKHAGPFFVCSASTSPQHPDKVWQRHPNHIRIAWTFRKSYLTTTTEKAHLLRARLSNWISNGRHDIKEKGRGKTVLYIRPSKYYSSSPWAGYSIDVEARRKWQNKSGGSVSHRATRLDSIKGRDAVITV